MVGSRSGGSSTSLRLRARASSGFQSEVFIVDGLTIGRSNANIIQVEDDDSGAVERTHARVEFCKDGTVRLKCVQPNSTIGSGGGQVSDLVLVPGATFRIGRTDFSIVSNVGEEAISPLNVGTGCPYCGWVETVATFGKAFECSSCRRVLLAVPPDMNFGVVRKLPGIFKDSEGVEFKADNFVARGGMGYVLRGSSGLGVRVAIKVLIWDSDTSHQSISRFQQEIELLKRLHDPNVLKLVSSGQEAGLFFYVMDWVDGHDLRKELPSGVKTGKLVDFSKAVRWFEQACLGLFAIHRAGAVHRDIKPSNLLLTGDGRLLIADLGVAKKLGENETGMTSTGQMPGTYWYMAPEQHYAPDLVDQRTDIYSLAFTFWELLTGVRPNTFNPVRPSAVNLTVPKEFDELLIWMLGGKITDRPGSFLDVLRSIPRGSAPDPAGIAVNSGPQWDASQVERPAKADVQGGKPPPSKTPTVNPEKPKTENHTKQDVEKGAESAKVPQSDGLKNHHTIQFKNEIKECLAKLISNIGKSKKRIIINTTIVVCVILMWIFIYYRSSGQQKAIKASSGNNEGGSLPVVLSTQRMDEIKELTKEEALALVKNPPSILDLEGLTSISHEVATVLSQCDCEAINLSGLKKLPPGIAIILSNLRGEVLNLSGISELSEEDAEAFSLFKGKILVLDGVRSISIGQARALSKFKAKEDFDFPILDRYLSLFGLESIPKDAAIILRENPRVYVPRRLLK